MSARKQRKLTPEEIREMTDLVEKSRSKLLTPLMVVERAKNKSSALHEHFTWDNGAAAEQWRIHEARDLIMRVKVELSVGKKQTEVRMFVSLGSDRINGGGYRPLKTVLSDAELRKEMLRTALAELEALRERYSRLEELVEVWRAMDRVKGVGDKK